MKNSETRGETLLAGIECPVCHDTYHEIWQHLAGGANGCGATVLNSAWADSPAEVTGKVYAAVAGEYSDYRVCHIFARAEDARAYRLGDAVEEYELREGPVDVRYWYQLSWHSEVLFPRTANPYEWSELADFDAGRKLGHNWVHDQNRSYLIVSGWDVQAVRKVYGEQRAQYEARQART
jgi:hypothetical protein